MAPFAAALVPTLLLRRNAVPAAAALGRDVARAAMPLGAGSRGAFMGEQTGLGRARLTGAMDGNMEKMQRSSGNVGELAKFGKVTPGLGEAAGASGHYQALANISTQISNPLSGYLGDSGPLNAWRERSARLRKVKDEKKGEEIFLASREFLMTPDKWTYGHMAGYQRKILELAGATGWKRKLSGDDPSILHLEKELRVLQAMTPAELLSNHKSVFTTDSKKLIAERASCTVKYVEDILIEHDILRADRRWYQILNQFKKPLPQSFEDRQFMAEFDRPFSESEKEYQEKMMDKHRQNTRPTVAPARINHTYYRIPTCGGNRWSTKVPRWYPTQWKVRPDRAARLSAVGSPGGGGDRGTRWGKNAAAAGSSR